MKTTLLFTSIAGLAAAQFSFNETTHKYTCAQPNQAYCVSGSMESNIILRCDSSAIGKPGNCNDVSFDLPHMLRRVVARTRLISRTEPCWGTSNGEYLLALLPDLQYHR